MIPDREATWITVWFDDSSAKCEYTVELEDRLKRIIRTNSIDATELPCLDGTKLNVRTEYIKGFYVTTKEDRVLSRDWQKILKDEMEPKEWD